MSMAPFSRRSFALVGVVVLSYGLPGCSTASAPRTPAAIATDGEMSDLEGVVRGFPALRTLEGKTLADGEFSQWVKDGRLHIKNTYQFSPAHRIEEQAVFEQEPQLLQRQWSWRELNDGRVDREFRIDFMSGSATAEKWKDSKVTRWSESLKIEPGRTFAGIGLSLVIKRLRGRLLQGEKIEVLAVGFTPKPQVVSVEISHGGVDRLPIAGRLLRGDRFVIHPKIPWIAKIFVKVSDTLLWLATPPPAGFLRSEGPLMEPGDPAVRIDLFPGPQSGPAEPESP